MALGGVVANITSTVTNTVLARKWLAQKLIALAELQLVLRPLCDEVKLDQGMGKTANFPKVARANLPLSPLTEGSDPDESAFPSISSVTVTVEQWGAFFTLTDVSELTTSHPILQIAVERLADVAARLIDSEIGKVMLGGTSVRYANGQANRGALTSADKMDEFELQKLRVILASAGAPARRGVLYDLVMPSEVEADLQKAQANFGTWAAREAFREDAPALRDATIGQFLGHNCIRSNFLPFAQRLGNDTTAITTSATNANAIGVGIEKVTGSMGLTGTYPVKVTRVDPQRGYEEMITKGHTIDPSSQDVKFTVVSSDTNAYYFYMAAAAGDPTDDSIYYKVAGPLTAGQTATIAAIPTSGTHPPATPPSSGDKVFICFNVAREALNLVTLQNLVTTMTPPEESESNPLALRRKVGFKFMNKAGRRDETRLIRWEGESSLG